jgi:ABC-type transporter Mla maintaining outer membrane lipid asymmetry permease subunit MlaE
MALNPTPLPHSHPFSYGSAKAFARAAVSAPHAARALLGVMHAQRDLSVIGVDNIAHDVMPRVSALLLYMSVK